MGFLSSLERVRVSRLCDTAPNVSGAAALRSYSARVIIYHRDTRAGEEGERHHLKMSSYMQLCDWTLIYRHPVFEYWRRLPSMAAESLPWENLKVILDTCRKGRKEADPVCSRMRNR